MRLDQFRDADHGGADAGVVDQAIDLAEPLDRVGDQGLDVGLAADIGLAEQHVVAATPAWTKRSAMRSPMPLVAPVMMATLPESAVMGGSPRFIDVWTECRGIIARGQRRAWWDGWT